ncbi:uncharacterized protein LOC133357732 [Lethenteron reissneri]|uniref:uncharacterized protein LOC133357732 n=1 Tax=Lethenteron reissneri TaxID=7753 RepID=UPI002AB68F41|nr:uncharacterized protein LOC133357732 [Lethenteron reissneri]
MRTKLASPGHKVTAWTGGPIVEGGAVGWDPKKAVYVPHGGGPQELTAASAQWPAREGPGPRSALPTRERRPGGSAVRRNDVECFRCSRKGHYARDCWARIPGPPQQEASTADVPRKDPPGQASRCAPDTRQGLAPHSSPLPRDPGVVNNGRPPTGPCRSVTQWRKLAWRVVAAATGSSTVPGSIQGVDVRILVDSGASATIISDVIFHLLSIPPDAVRPVYDSCVTANGGNMGIVGQVDANISIGGVSASGTVLISRFLVVPCLLGTDFLANMPILIRRSRPSTIWAARMWLLEFRDLGAKMIAGFVPNFATIARPLHLLTGKGRKFSWGLPEEVAFKDLRDRLATAPTLDYPDFDHPFILDTDASDTGIGAILSQSKGGVEHVVAYGGPPLVRDGPERRAPLKMWAWRHPPNCLSDRRPPIAAGDEIQAAQGRLAQLLHP